MGQTLLPLSWAPWRGFGLVECFGRKRATPELLSAHARPAALPLDE